MEKQGKYLWRAGEGRSEPIQDLENATRIIVVDEETVGSQVLTFGYLRWEPKISYHKKHVHENAEEIMYILSGRGVGGVGDQAMEVKKGDTVWVPRGAVHWMDNPYPEALEMLLVYSEPSLAKAGYQVLG